MWKKRGGDTATSDLIGTPQGRIAIASVPLPVGGGTAMSGQPTPNGGQASSQHPPAGLSRARQTPPSIARRRRAWARDACKICVGVDANCSPDRDAVPYDRYELGAAGPMRDTLVASVLRGEKTVTSSLLVQYEEAGETVPNVGRNVLVNSDEQPVALI